MRWIIVLLILYVIPLIILFRNYKDFKRSCIYGSIYVVLATTIVISNIYMSGLNKIKEALYYQNYVSDERYKDKYVSNFEKQYRYENKEQPINNVVEKDKLDEIKNNEDKKEDKQEDKSSQISKEPKEDSDVASSKNSKTSMKEFDIKTIADFKKDIYDIERIALIPMRDCVPYTKNISQNLKNISNIRKDIEYAQDMCNDVVKIYDTMDIPLLSNDQYTEMLDSARNDVRKAYELRGKAMENATKLVDTKNPKYIVKITEYLNLSDKQIDSFKERIDDLNNKINKN